MYCLVRTHSLISPGILLLPPDIPDCLSPGLFVCDPEDRLSFDGYKSNNIVAIWSVICDVHVEDDILVLKDLELPPMAVSFSLSLNLNLAAVGMVATAHTLASLQNP